MKNKFLILVIIIYSFIAIYTSHYAITSANYITKDDAYTALQSVMYSYYMRGENIQYNSRKVAYFPPEEATIQNTNYMVCSGFVRNVYNEFLGIKIPEITTQLLNYGRDYIGNPEVVLYGEKDSSNNVIIKIYDTNYTNNLKTLTNPSLNEILPYLQPGDILTYTGHTIMIYDLIYDTTGNVVDAYFMHSAHGKATTKVFVKLPREVTIGNVSFGAINHRLWYSKIQNSDFELLKDPLELAYNVEEGSLNIDKLSNNSYWANISTNKRNQYSILRVIHEDSNRKAILNFELSETPQEYLEDPHITLNAKNADRVKFPKLYIEKTVDVSEDTSVIPNQKVTYTIKVKNNSINNYNNNIVVKENLSPYASFHSQSCSKSSYSFTNNSSSGILQWNIGKLDSLDDVTIIYSVTVKQNTDGNTLTSTGSVENIPNTEINNPIVLDFSDSQKASLASKTSTLISSGNYTGKQLIDEIYKQALGMDLGISNLNLTTLIKKVSPTNSTSANSIKLDQNSLFTSLILNNYWNALWSEARTFQTSGDIIVYDLRIWHDYTNPDRRADTIYEQNFKTGDILIYLNSNDVIYSYKDSVFKKREITFEDGEYAYIYIDGEGFVGLNKGNNLSQTKDDRNAFNSQYYMDNLRLLFADNTEATIRAGDTSPSNVPISDEMLEYVNYQTLFGKDYYVILRPSLLLNQGMKGDLDNDKNITILDVRLLLQTIINNGENADWSNQDLAIMDMDSNGKVNILDVRLLLQAYINQ